MERRGKEWVEIGRGEKYWDMLLVFLECFRKFYFLLVLFFFVDSIL